MGHFATGVTVVASMLDGAPCGMTANAITSVSLDPPLLLFCAEHTSDTLKGINQSGFFAVSILDQTYERLSRRFAAIGAKSLEGIAWRTETTGAPVLEDALGWLDCTVWASYEGGDHTIVVGVVEAADAHEGKPLVFYRGGYHFLGD